MSMAKTQYSGHCYVQSHGEMPELLLVLKLPTLIHLVCHHLIAVKFLKFTLILYLCVWRMCVEGRGQLAGINSCLALGGPNSGCQPWWEVPVPSQVNWKQVLKVLQLILEVLIFPSQIKTAPVALVFVLCMSEHTHKPLINYTAQWKVTWRSTF